MATREEIDLAFGSPLFDRRPDLPRPDRYCGCGYPVEGTPVGRPCPNRCGRLVGVEPDSKEENDA